MKKFRFQLTVVTSDNATLEGTTDILNEVLSDVDLGCGAWDLILAEHDEVEEREDSFSNKENLSDAETDNMYEELNNFLCS